MKQSLLILLAVLSISLLSAVQALHVMPGSYLPGADLELVVEITQPDAGLRQVTLQYRAAGETQWTDAAMREDDPGFWRGSIPRGVYGTSEVEYRFEFELTDGALEYLPGAESQQEAYVIAPRASAGTKSDAFVLLSDDSRITGDEDYLLAVSFLAIADEIEPGTMMVFVDDRNVSKNVQVSGSTLVYRESKPLPGIKKALVTARANGKEIYSNTWITEVLPGSRKRALPFSYRGAVNLSANAYSSSDEGVSFGNTLSDFATWGDLYAQYGMLDLSTKLYLSSLEESNKQAVNRYSFGLQIPWLKLVFGDNSPELTEYTLNGKNIRGLHSEITTKYLNIILAHGESVRKTTNEGDAASGIPKSGTFKQEAFGIKLAMGRKDGFSVGLTGTRHRDVISSLDPEYYRYVDTAGDTLYSVKARDNAVVAADIRLNVPDQHVMMGVEVAASMLNTNTIPGVISNEELAEYTDELDVNPADYEQFFVINKNMEPFEIGEANMAWKLYLRSYILNNMINVEYSQVGSAFSSFGSHQSLGDTKVLSVSDQFAIGRYLNLTGAYTQTEDNIMGHQTDTNNYSTIQAQAIFRYPNLPYLKASFYLNKSENEKNNNIESDSFLPYLADSQLISFGMGYNIEQIPYVPSQIDFSYRMGNDQREIGNSDTRAMDLVNDNANSGLNISMTNRFLPIPLKTHLSYSTAENKDEITDAILENNRIYFRAEYSLLKEILKPYLSYSVTALSGDQDTQNYNVAALGLMAYPMRNLSISTDLALNSMKNEDNADLDYNTTTWRLLISQRF